MFILTVCDEGLLKKLNALQGKSVSDILRENNYHISAVCGGRGICGKCAIRLLRGFLEITAGDREFFSEAELNAGMRLACTAFMTGDIEIIIPGTNDNGFKVLSFYRQIRPAVPDAFNLPQPGKSVSDLGIAIDIGTTTICLDVLNLRDGRVLSSHSGINSQRAYGTDVISRISASVAGKLSVLRDCVREDIRGGIERALRNAGLPAGNVRKIHISANTTMIHLLLGVSCQSLGVAPFTPVITGKCEYPFYDVFESRMCDCPVTILPSVSAFVGSDITAGILFCDAHVREKYSLLVDLGTNGEMALCRKNSILCTSTAAGPAFEGGNISCGTGSVPGAISKIRYENSGFNYETINNQPPVGICGSGLTDAMACLIENGLIDETGLLIDEYFDDGVEIAPGIFLTQKDIREFQLAKSAVRAGIEVLVKTAGISIDDIEAIYIAGGFGFHMNTAVAARVGLVPCGLADRVVAPGNSSLGGCALTLLENNSLEAIEKIASEANEINLAGNKLFTGLFAEYMYF